VNALAQSERHVSGPERGVVLWSKDAKTDRLRQRGLPVVIGYEALHLERHGGGDVQDVECPSTERSGVLRTQLGGELERTAPEDIEDREPPVANVGIEIGDRRASEALVDFFAMDCEVDRVDELCSPEARDREATSEPPSPGAEACGTVVVYVYALGSTYVRSALLTVSLVERPAGGGR